MRYNLFKNTKGKLTTKVNSEHSRFLVQVTWSPSLDPASAVFFSFYFRAVLWDQWGFLSEVFLEQTSKLSVRAESCWPLMQPLNHFVWPPLKISILHLNALWQERPVTFDHTCQNSFICENPETLEFETSVSQYEINYFWTHLKNIGLVKY